MLDVEKLKIFVRQLETIPRTDVIMHWKFFLVRHTYKHVANNMLKPGLRGPGWPVRNSEKNQYFCMCIQVV